MYQTFKICYLDLSLFDRNYLAHILHIKLQAQLFKVENIYNILDSIELQLEHFCNDYKWLNQVLNTI
jgi:hypothetical protein